MPQARSILTVCFARGERMGCTPRILDSYSPRRQAANNEPLQRVASLNFYGNEILNIFTRSPVRTPFDVNQIPRPLAGGDE